MAGRPWKYKQLIEILDDDELYTTGKIIRRAEGLGLFDRDFDDSRKLNPMEKRKAKTNARSAISIMANKKMPEPDGEIEVTKPYKATYRAWTGRTWKDALGA